MTKQTILIPCFCLIALLSCKTTHTLAVEGMVRIAILYPAEKGKTFDMRYYEKNHMPMMAAILGKNLKYYEIDKGIAGRTDKDEIPFTAIGYFFCRDLTAYRNAVTQNIQLIREDIKKYTDIQPVVQISEIKKARINRAK